MLPGKFHITVPLIINLLEANTIIAIAQVFFNKKKVKR